MTEPTFPEILVAILRALRDSDPFRYTLLMAWANSQSDDWTIEEKDAAQVARAVEKELA